MPKLALIRVYTKNKKEPTIKLISLKKALSKFGKFGSWKTKEGIEQFIYSGDSKEIKKRINEIRTYDKERQCRKTAL